MSIIAGDSPESEILSPRAVEHLQVYEDLAPPMSATLPPDFDLEVRFAIFSVNTYYHPILVTAALIRAGVMADGKRNWVSCVFCF